MKRTLCMLALIMAILVVPLSPVAAHAEKAGKRRDIAIVFDNSGSMYVQNNMAWCRATYAMEVFAAMMNEGDTLSVYPMNAVEIDGKTYSSESPVTVQGPGDAGILRKLYTPMAGITPIETLDEAYRGLSDADGERWLIVLTDGNAFYENNTVLETNTVQKLSERLETYNRDMNILYLGIGEVAAMPEVSGNEVYTYFADKAADSNQVLSRLTAMCNMIFGRDTLPKNHRSGDTIDFDLTLSKLIVFVQGENVKNISLTDDAGNPVGNCVDSYQTHFSELGSGNNGGTPDTSLQGCVATYENCPAGRYHLTCDGTPTSTEIYYEPDVDLVFTFTDSDGNVVDPNLDLYEGDYTVSYGLRDAVTGEIADSDLLGSPSYDILYTINGEEKNETGDGQTGSFSVHLADEDTFNAKITARYLSGYTITKTGEDFGWPSGGLTVTNALRIKIEERQESLSLSGLEESTPYRLEIFYNGAKLTGDALESCELLWNETDGAAMLKKNPQGDYYEILFEHRDAAHPENTDVGDFTVKITAEYSPDNTKTLSACADLNYSIVDDGVSVGVGIECEQTYYRIGHFAEGAPILVYLSRNGRPLTDEELENAVLTVDADGLDYEILPVPGESAYRIVLRDSAGVGKGGHKLQVKALLSDAIGRSFEGSDRETIRVGTLPRWVKWLIGILIVLVILAVVAFIMTRKVFPKKCLRVATSFDVDGHEITGNAKVAYSTKKNGSRKNGSMKKKTGSLKIEAPPDLPVGYSALTCLVRITLVPISPRYVRSAKRRVEIADLTAPDGVETVEINSCRYTRDEHNHMVKETSVPTQFGGLTTITVSGTAINSRAKKKNATLTQQIKFK